MIRVSAATRQELINKSLRSTKGKQRYYRRLFSKIEYPNRALSRVDVNKWFKEDILDADISVQGETNKYTVTISFYGVWENYEGELSRKSIKDAITKAYRSEDIFIYCTCPDFCFTGDTKVKLLDGRTLTMKEIAEEFAQGKELWVYASDEKGDFKPGKVTAAWETHKVNELVRVTLDNGEVIECTPEHLFMLRDGRYEEAQNLTAGVSLMPMYLRVDRKGYEQVKLNSSAIKSDYRSTYKLVANEIKRDEIAAKEKEGDGVAIHHIDFNKANNTPENLRIMGVQEHYLWHSHHAKESGSYDKWRKAGDEYWADPESRKKQGEVMSRVIRNWWATMSDEERRAHEAKMQVVRDNIDKEKRSQSLSKVRSRFYASMTQEERSEYSKKSINQPGAKEKARVTRSATLKAKFANMTEEERANNKFINSARGVVRSEETRQKMAASGKAFREQERSNPDRELRPLTVNGEERIRLQLQRIIKAGLPLREENYVVNRKSGDVYWQYNFRTWEDVLKHYHLDEYNHKVVSVERVQCNEVPVYDLEVERWHNFRLAAGVMVHNCYRYSYVATQNGYITKHIQTIPAPIRNPHDSLGSACKHVLLCLFQSQRWITELANNTYKYIQYIKKSNPTMYKNIIAPIVEIDTQQEPMGEGVSDEGTRIEETDEVKDNGGAERTTEDEGA